MKKIFGLLIIVLTITSCYKDEELHNHELIGKWERERPRAEGVQGFEEITFRYDRTGKIIYRDFLVSTNEQIREEQDNLKNWIANDGFFQTIDENDNIFYRCYY